MIKHGLCLQELKVCLGGEKICFLQDFPSGPVVKTSLAAVVVLVPSQGAKIPCPCSQKSKAWSRSNTVTNSIKTLKMVTSKKCFKKIHFFKFSFSFFFWCFPFLANNHQVRQNMTGAVRMTLGNAIDEFRVGTITKYPLNYEDEVAGKGFLGVDAFTWDLDGQEGLDDAKIGGRDIWCKKSSVTKLAVGKGRYNQGAKVSYWENWEVRWEW